MWATHTEGQLLAWSEPSAAHKDPFSLELLWKALLQDGCSVAVNCVVGRLSIGGLCGTAFALDSVPPSSLTVAIMGELDEPLLCLCAPENFPSRAASQRWPSFPSFIGNGKTRYENGGWSCGEKEKCRLWSGTRHVEHQQEGDSGWSSSPGQHRAVFTREDKL